MTTQITFFIPSNHFIWSKEERFLNGLDPRGFFLTHKEQESIYRSNPDYATSLKNIVYISLKTEEGARFRSIHNPILCRSILQTHSCASNCMNIHHLPVYWAWHEIIEEIGKHARQKPIAPPPGILINRSVAPEPPVGLKGLNPENDPVYRPK